MQRPLAATFFLVLCSGCTASTSVDPAPESQEPEPLEEAPTPAIGHLDIDRSAGVATVDLAMAQAYLRLSPNSVHVPARLDGQPSSLDHMVTAQLTVSLDEITLGEPTRLEKLSSDNRFLWRHSHFMPDDGVCPGYVSNHEGDKICGYEWITEEIVGGTQSAVEFVVRALGEDRLDVEVTVPVFHQRNPDGGELWCCADAGIRRDVSVGGDGTYELDHGGFVRERHCWFDTYQDAVASGCTMVGQ